MSKRERERRWNGEYNKIPSYDPDLSTLDPQTRATVETVWTVLIRAYESEQWDIDERDVELAFFNVYLNPGASLTADEIEDLERFESALSNDRRDGRQFNNLTATETSFMRIVERGLQRLRADPLGNELTPISEFMADDESETDEDR